MRIMPGSMLCGATGVAAVAVQAVHGICAAILVVPAAIPTE